MDERTAIILVFFLNEEKDPLSLSSLALIGSIIKSTSPRARAPPPPLLLLSSSLAAVVDNDSAEEASFLHLHDLRLCPSSSFVRRRRITFTDAERSAKKTPFEFYSLRAAAADAGHSSLFPFSDLPRRRRA